MPPFRPLFRNPHLQTIAGHFWPRADVSAQRRLFQTEPGVKVLVQSCGAPGPAVVLVHGLEGSGEAGYMRGMTAASLRAGFSAHRFHMRTCGGTEHLCSTLYHAGLTSDLLAVLRQLRNEGHTPAFLVGFSLGGNVVLKLAGELAESASDLIGAVCAISTPIDLAACARRISQRDNYFYERRFVRRMRARLRASGRYSDGDLSRLHKLIAIDDRITAPSFGFGGAAHYYETQSALRFLSAIRVPALLIQAKDDHFIPFDIFQSDAVQANPAIDLIATDHGGHLGFLGRGPHRFWAEETALRWIAAQSSTARTPEVLHHE
jgi:predicted alpha/beta-fold hydrolase